MEFLPGSVLQILNDRIETVEEMEGGLQDWANSVNDSLSSIPVFPIAISSVTGLQTTLDSKGTSSFSGSYADLSGKPSLFNGAYSSLSGIPGTFAPSSHTHVINDISNTTTVGKAVMGASSAEAGRTAIGITAQTHIGDAATNAPVNAATNAPTNAKTDYNVLTTLLGAVTDGLNQTNTAQNTISSIVNANATKQNAGFVILNALATKFNLNLDILESNGLMAA